MQQQRHQSSLLRFAITRQQDRNYNNEKFMFFE